MFMLLFRFRGILGTEQMTSYWRIKLSKDYFSLFILRPTNNNSNYIKTSDRYWHLSVNLVTFSSRLVGMIVNSFPFLWLFTRLLRKLSFFALVVFFLFLPSPIPPLYSSLLYKKQKKIHLTGITFWRTGRDYPNDSIAEDGQNIEMSPGDLRRLAVT